MTDDQAGDWADLERDRGQGDPARRRSALVIAAHTAAAATPPGVDAGSFAAAALADSYEVLADLDRVRSGVVGTGAAIADLLWPGAIHLDRSTTSLREIANAVAGQADELVIIPADVPDLPGLVIAKIFKALNRADVVLAPERGTVAGDRAWVGIGIRLPWPAWLEIDLDLDRDDHDRLLAAAPRRTSVAIAPDWHRMRRPDSVHRLDPGLEGWDETRALLSGHALSGRP